MATARSESDVIVIDASLTVRLLFSNPAQSTVQNRFRRWIDAGLTVLTPSLWVYEMTSAINKSVHFGQLTQEEGEAALQQARSLDITVAAPNPALAQRAFVWMTRLQRASAYDSFYFALADEHHAPLWTADINLCRAANLDWVRLGTEEE